MSAVYENGLISDIMYLKNHVSKLRCIYTAHIYIYFLNLICYFFSLVLVITGINIIIREL